MVKHDGSMTATMPRSSFRAAGATQGILVAAFRCYTTLRHFAYSVLKSEFRRRMLSFGWMLAILSLIFDANTSAGRSAVSRMSSAGTDIILYLHLRFVRNPGIGSFSDVSTGHHVP
jgi:hypothetical protein